jgi:ubiquinone/menaquinone biosynthesis C-methylase UbiE
MEIKDKEAVWLNPDHPNFQRWQNGRHLSKERAITVNEVVSLETICKALKILDIGSGEGGTSAFFSDSNHVISYDIDLRRLGKQKQVNNLVLINGDAEYLPFRKSGFDLIILQDVIEHINNRNLLVKELMRVLKDSGLIYISTPNKFSLLNIISDPHWGIPLLSLFNRDGIKKYFLRFFRKKDLTRNDIAQLLSLKEIIQLFPGYKIMLHTKEVANFLSEDYKGIIWSSLHIKLYHVLKKSGLILLLKYFANNKFGFINNYFTPTYYLTIRNN